MPVTCGVGVLMKQLVARLTVTTVSCLTIAVAGGAGSGASAALAGHDAVGAPNVSAPLPLPLRLHAAASKISFSYNWAGYVQSAKKRNTFTGVTSTIFVTTVKTSVPGSQYSSDWVGIDGGNRRARSLVQAGVEEDNLGGTASYYAWTEILPAPEVPLGLVIGPGDEMTVSVRETAIDRWTMTVSDDSKKTSSSTTVSYATPGVTVEAIHERTCVTGFACAGTDFPPLATTTDETFEQAQFTSSPAGSTAAYSPLLAPVNGATLSDVVMVANRKTVLAIPSGPNGAENGFSVADGATPPPS